MCIISPKMGQNLQSKDDFYMIVLTSLFDATTEPCCTSFFSVIGMPQQKERTKQEMWSRLSVLGTAHAAAMLTVLETTRRYKCTRLQIKDQTIMMWYPMSGPWIMAIVKLDCSQRIQWRHPSCWNDPKGRRKQIIILLMVQCFLSLSDTEREEVVDQRISVHISKT